MNNKDPVPTVGVVIIKDNKVLLVKHKKGADHLNDTWGLPAGRINEGEDEKEAVARELREETGLTVKRDLIPLPTIYRATIQKKSGPVDMTYKVFLAKEFEGELLNSIETDPEWIELERLNEIELIVNVDHAIKEALNEN